MLLWAVLFHVAVCSLSRLLGVMQACTAQAYHCPVLPVQAWRAHVSMQHKKARATTRFKVGAQVKEPTIIKAGLTARHATGLPHAGHCLQAPTITPFCPSYLQLNIQLRAFVGWQEVASYRAGLGAKQVQLRSVLEERLLGQVGAAARLLG